MPIPDSSSRSTSATAPSSAGYSFGSFETDDGFQATAPKLYGSRMIVANAELRVPLFGTRDFGLINVPFLPTELALFGDAGLPGAGSIRTISRQDPRFGPAPSRTSSRSSVPARRRA
jgi:hypothetical protein